MALVVATVDQPFPPILPVAVFVAYHTVLTWWVGCTIGKALVGLRVLRPGRKISFWWALVRSGPGYLLVGVAGLGVLTSAFDSRRRATYDVLLGGEVVQIANEAQQPAGVLDRLVRYAEEHKAASAERTKTFVVLSALWAWLLDLGAQLRRALTWLRGGSAATERGTSVLEVASGKVAALASAGLVGVASVVVAVVPPARDAGSWLLTDRYWLGDSTVTAAASGGDALLASDPETAIARWFEPQDVSYAGTCPYPPTDEQPVSVCIAKPERVTSAQLPDLAGFGVTEGSVHLLAPTNSFHGDGHLLVLKEEAGWRVGAIQLFLGDLGELQVSRWIPAEAGLQAAFDEVYGNGGG